MKISGSIIRAHIDWVVGHASRDEIIEFFEMLPPDVRSTISHMRASASYDETTLCAVERTIDAMFGKAWH